VESEHDDELAIAIFKDIENNTIDFIVSRLKKHWFYHNSNWETVLGSIPDLSLATIVHGKVNLERTAAAQLRRDESDQIMMGKHPKLSEVVEAVVSLSASSPSRYHGSFFDRDHMLARGIDDDLSMLEEKLRVDL
jgi:hypothetical protein